MDLSIIIVSWNTRDLLLECLASLRSELEPEPRCEPIESEVFVVDNGSDDGSAEAVRERHPWVQLIPLPENRGYAAGNNVALRRARGRVILLLNSDVALESGVLAHCLGVLDSESDVGAAGIQLLHPDGRLQNSIHTYPSAWHEPVPRALLEIALPRRFPSKRHVHTRPIEVDAVLGAVLFVRREVVEDVGFLCEDYFFFLEETDWCRRMHQAGYRILHIPDSRAIHRSGASSKQKHPLETRIEYHRSLHHFLRVHRGPLSAGVARSLRVIKSLLSLAPLAIASLVSVRQRERLRSVWGVLVWHLRGCPGGGGLRGLDRSPISK